MHARTVWGFRGGDNALIESALAATWPPDRFLFDITVAREHSFLLLRLSNGRAAASRSVFNPDSDTVGQILRLVAELIEST